MKKYLLVLLILSSLAAAGQDCAQSLRLAKATYDQGRLHEVEQNLKGCLTSGSTAEKEDAYKLICLSYIYLEEPEKADEAMLNLLRNNNYFEISESDPAEFVALYKSFRTREIYRVGAVIGLNLSTPTVTKQISTCTNCTGSFSGQLGIQGGLSFEIPISDRISINPQLIFQQKKLGYTNEVTRAGGITNNTTGTENQSWISLPIGIEYTLFNKGYRPYITAGVTADYLIGSNLTLLTTQDQAGAVQEKTISINNMRKDFLSSLYAGAGAKLRLFGGYVSAEIRYQYGLMTVNSTETAFANPSPAFNNNWGDSIYRLSAVSFSIGYIQNVFNPKKLTRKK